MSYSVSLCIAFAAPAALLPMAASAAVVSNEITDPSIVPALIAYKEWQRVFDTHGAGGAVIIDQRTMPGDPRENYGAITEELRRVRSGDVRRN